jgi:hypothetical protein
MDRQTVILIPHLNDMIVDPDPPVQSQKDKIEKCLEILAFFFRGWRLLLVLERSSWFLI